jgi:hypothetical protein
VQVRFWATGWVFFVSSGSSGRTGRLGGVDRSRRRRRRPSHRADTAPPPMGAAHSTSAATATPPRRLPVDILSDTLLVSRALVRSLLGHPSQGLLRKVPFPEPASDAPHRGARLELAIAGVSVAPQHLPAPRGGRSTSSPEMAGSGPGSASLGRPDGIDNCDRSRFPAAYLSPMVRDLHVGTRVRPVSYDGWARPPRSSRASSRASAI